VRTKRAPSFRRLETLVKRFGPAKEVPLDEGANVEDPSQLVTILDVDGRLVGAKGWHYVSRFTYLLFAKPIPDAICDGDTEIRGIWTSEYEQLP
jgi:hypothetical protein